MRSSEPDMEMGMCNVFFLPGVGQALGPPQQENGRKQATWYHKRLCVVYLGRMSLQDLTGSIPNRAAAAVKDQRGPVTVTPDSLILVTSKQRINVLEGESCHQGPGMCSTPGAGASVGRPGSPSMSRIGVCP